ncbi:Hypothetical predicted protein [Olea europaea subsp. europaea]|uniref:Uncharacterized protein n=1 Tax=Olea europaea subsp. europaea TaxID=158383 RepID=A0A8S0TE87_OLEEU|nr:Hypothetical predicted protein [Olea europaea subsp. europaea]
MMLLFIYHLRLLMMQESVLSCLQYSRSLRKKTTASRTGCRSLRCCPQSSSLVYKGDNENHMMVGLYEELEHRGRKVKDLEVDHAILEKKNDELKSLPEVTDNLVLLASKETLIEDDDKNEAVDADIADRLPSPRV